MSRPIDNWREEQRAAYLYRLLSELEAGTPRARLFTELVREELGLNPDELGSPWGAALFSFLAFAAGALVPLLSFLVLDARLALGGSIVLTALALFGVGAALSLFTGRQAGKGGLRMLLIGGVAGVLTWSIGPLLGVALP